MNEKEIELIKSLAALLKKFKKPFHLGSLFISHYAAIEEDEETNDASDSVSNDICLLNTIPGNDSTGENAIGYLIKKENLTNKKIKSKSKSNGQRSIIHSH